MIYYSFLLSTTALLSAAAAASSYTGPGCPQTGPVLATSAIVYATLSKVLSARLANLTSGNSLSAAGVSTKQTHLALHINGGGKVLAKAYHTASNRNEAGVRKVDGGTYFRVASVTKVFTYLRILLERSMQRDDKIGKWIKELDPHSPEGEEVGAGEWWDQVTLEMLASHLGGIQRDEWFLDYANTPNLQLLDLPARGWPRIPPFEVSKDCGGPVIGFDAKNMSDLECIKRSTIIHAARSSPVNEPGTRPMYSDLGFALLGFALEKATGRSFADAIETLIFDKLGMDDSSMTKPDDCRGAIPSGTPEEVAWSLIEGAGQGQGAMYTTPDDMSKFLNGVHRLFSGPAAFRRWLSPMAFLSSNFELVGAPWEISRVNAYTPDARPITVYRKNGYLSGYYSTIAFIPEYNISFSAFIASGDPVDLSSLGSALLKVVVEESEKAAREGSLRRFAGEYLGQAIEPLAGDKNRTSKGTIRMKITIEAKDTVAGLRVDEFKNGEKDILREIWFIGMGTPPPDGVEMHGRLFSTTEDGKEWRLTADFNAKNQIRDMLSAGVYADPDSQCAGWMGSASTYGGNETGLVRFEMGEGGAMGLEVPSMGIKLQRVDSYERTNSESEQL